MKLLCLLLGLFYFVEYVFTWYHGVQSADDLILGWIFMIIALLLEIKEGLKR